LHDADAYETVQLERDILKGFHGGCQIPLGVYVANAGHEIHLWISKGEQWDTPVKRVFGRMPSSNIPTAESLVNQFQQITPQSVFISRQVTTGDIFYDWLSASGFSVSGQSLIDINYLDFEYIGDADWLFFTSKNGVKAFFEKVTFENGKSPKIAAINKGTAMDIVQADYDVSFIGTSSDTTETIRHFATIASGTVLFPKAQNSAQDLPALARELGLNAASLVVYTNQAKVEIEERNEAILVFTSPMNVSAYFEKFSLKNDQQVVSIGPSTSKALEKFGVKYYESFDPMPWSLSDAVMWLSSITKN
jgi:uroporphyrinogen-III synthase